ncbi:inorganic phosphate transporter [Rhodobacteraceae bacterium RKSG542]|uniref:inorganic phosphate transporter n=1 Tax=Pseudovibrio flavus TaxID=2529854 RepID=UPI0012BBA073|nr:inorganic phosphate transporter [Pseudovibrio flavus]MTI19304.1 inorganic phosphate transporter [Pseudovibrio flavus]
MNKVTRKQSLDKDLERLSGLELQTSRQARRLLAPALSIVFLLTAMAIASFYVTGDHTGGVIIAAAGFGAYLALNIGANDVANNVGPAVGSRALSIVGALIIASVFESAGALIAGGDVVSTISKGVVDPEAISQSAVFIRVMMAALISAALWVNLATVLGAPVSTTHAVVGGVMGSAIAAAGFVAVNWPTMYAIAASWVISPVLGGVIAALFLAFIKYLVIYRDDKIEAAKTWVPVLIAVMAGAFAAYLSLKGLSKLVKVSMLTASLIGVGFFVVTWIMAIPYIRRQATGMKNKNSSLKKLFRAPLIFSAALLSFAHGANDVANAIGPLSAIVHTAQFGSVVSSVSIPMWVMLIGAFGISFGLLLFGPKLIRIVGEKITKLNPMRAYCVALSAAITVIVASGLGLPVSSTHIAVGAIFGVGFFREWFIKRSKTRVRYVRKDTGKDKYLIDGREAQKIALVRRSHFTSILAAWVITVPAAAALSATVYWVLSFTF